MSEVLKIALTAFGAVVVFVVGQIIQKWFIEPIQEQRKLVGEILHASVYYSNLYGFSEAYTASSQARKEGDLEGRAKELLDEAYKHVREKTSEGVFKLRDLSSRVYQNIQLIPCYGILERIWIVHKREKFYEVAIKLQEWSNNPDLENTIECQNRIIDLLNVKFVIKAAEEREKQSNAQQPVSQNDQNRGNAMNNRIKMIFEVIYKVTIVALFLIAVFLLKDIRSRQQVFPTVGELDGLLESAKKKDAKGESLEELSEKGKALMNSRPVVQVRGGSLEYVSTVGEVTFVKEVIGVDYVKNPVSISAR